MVEHRAVELGVSFHYDHKILDISLSANNQELSLESIPTSRPDS